MFRNYYNRTITYQNVKGKGWSAGPKGPSKCLKGNQLRK